MSKSNLNTREKILDKALEMFNERGIEYVGLRELAAVLGMRVSNITYYFPTKDDLVYALALELNKSNSAVITEQEHLSMEEFWTMLHQVFLHHVKFRCLLLSVVHLLSQNRHMAATYKKTQASRTGTIRSNLLALMRNGYLHSIPDTELALLVSGISLISRFWISEAAISFRTWRPEQQIRHYLAMIANLLKPYTTEIGRKQTVEFLNKLS